MNIAELIDQVELEISPILDIVQIEVSFTKTQKKRFSNNILENPNQLNVSIVIFYDTYFNNFTTSFYNHNPLPKTVKEIVTAIKEEMKEQNVPFKKPERKRPLNGIEQVEVL
ncbi:hypothetical protein SAMN05443667_101271 [Flavobacterium gillisiae]|uniref:Uncharacterized protein n=1 Tax=Flavobacterium gillisiae TaxID=150146 RepID=A0A1H3WYF1_9FLAO|nr:hypothetical protein [Flavobacterium gillisiae]SDZ91414.1 hypothetical protein SAMN05443667_101271 [Flavobacterium gillisiae]